VGVFREREHDDWRFRLYRRPRRRERRKRGSSRWPLPCLSKFFSLSPALRYLTPLASSRPSPPSVLLTVIASRRSDPLALLPALHSENDARKSLIAFSLPSTSSSSIVHCFPFLGHLRRPLLPPVVGVGPTAAPLPAPGAPVVLVPGFSPVPPALLLPLSMKPTGLCTSTC
jgi:hypothetical protein